jgi:membrane-associated phospholipid phosphatase
MVRRLLVKTHSESILVKGWFHPGSPATLPKMKQFFTTFTRSVVNCFTPGILVWHVLAILITFTLVHTGFDWWFYRATHTPEIRSWMFPAVLIGFYLPIYSPPILLLTGYAIRSRRVLRSGWAMLQTELLALLISSSYKAFTGREHPLRIMAQDNSQVFHFGFMRGGVFWGWPSSHTTIAFAMAFVIVTLFPKPRWLGCVVVVYALYVGLGVSMTIHWFSDFAAGAILGGRLELSLGGNGCPNREIDSRMLYLKSNGRRFCLSRSQNELTPLCYGGSAPRKKMRLQRNK